MRTSRHGGDPPTPFDEQTLRVLRTAHGQIRSAPIGDTAAIYDTCRAAAQCLSPADDFFIAIIDPHRRVTTFPYFSAGGELIDSGVFPYGAFGLTQWLVDHRRPYRFAQDDGHLYRRGWNSSAEGVVGDAVVVPLLQTDGSVIGYMGATSALPGAFDDELVHALEWLADLLVQIGLAPAEMASERATWVYPAEGDRLFDDDTGMLNYLSEQLLGLRSDLLRAAEQVDAGAVQAALTEIASRCDLLRTNILTTHGTPQARGWDQLTPREAEVASLIVTEALSNAEIAARLSVGETTVKTHVAHILTKVKASDRHELKWLAPPKVSSSSRS